MLLICILLFSSYRPIIIISLVCRQYQYSKAVGGRCGVCGDKWGVDNPENEAGGTYAKGIIARTYRRGQSVRVRVEITAHHRGYFEFRLCPNNDFTRRVTHECLDRYVLPLTGSSGTRFDISHGTSGNYEVDVQLPSDVTCTQCVLQWKYHTGESPHVHRSPRTRHF